MNKMISICGESYQKYLYCGALYENSITQVANYDDLAEGGRTRVKDGSASSIDSCYTTMEGLTDRRLFMNGAAATKLLDHTNRVGFLRGTESRAIKSSTFDKINPPEFDDAELYPTGYNYIYMVNKAGDIVDSGNLANSMAKVEINEKHIGFEGPCAAYNQSIQDENAKVLADLLEKSLAASKEAETTDAAATALEDKADVSGDEKDIIIAQLSREVADAAEQKRKDAQAAVDALTPPTLNVLDRFLALNQWCGGPSCYFGGPVARPRKILI
jgi:hypothetical protein